MALDAGCLGPLVCGLGSRGWLIDTDAEGYILAVRPSIARVQRLNAEDDWIEIDLENPVDHRQKKLSMRVIRQGQKGFRAALMNIWAGRCPITKTAVPAVLEGAHIFKYLGEATNDVRNGLLLRADIHKLFDSHLMSLMYDGDDLIVKVSNQLKRSRYWVFHDRKIGHGDIKPCQRLVAHHYESFRTSSDKAVRQLK